MYICDMCNNPIEAGTQYVNVFDKNVCLDCAVRYTLDDVMATFGITYMEAPDDIIVAATVDGQAIDATPEQVENFFHSENPVFVPTQVGEKITDEEDDDPNAIHEKNGWYYPGTDCSDDTEEMTDEEGERVYEQAQENPVLVPTQVGEKNTVLTTLCARRAEHSYKKAWVYESARDAKYYAEHYLKNMPNLLSFDGFVSEEEIPDGYTIYRVDGDNDESDIVN